MKQLINLICKLTVSILLISVNNSFAFSQDTCKYVSVKIGVYEFTDQGTKRFYKVVPTINIDYSFFQKTHLSFRVSSGLAFTSVIYNSKRHRLYLIPANINAIYTFTESDTKIRPFFGTGITIHFKLDKNEFFNESHYSLTYGYNITSGLDFPLKNNLTFLVEVNYIILTPSLFESLDMSGILFMVGFKLPLKL